MKKELEKFIKEGNFNLKIEVTDEDMERKLLKISRDVFEEARREEIRLNSLSYELAKKKFVG